jgi:hypothetical protein
MVSDVTAKDDMVAILGVLQNPGLSCHAIEER